MAELRAIYFSPASSCWKRGHAKRLPFKVLKVDGQALLEHIATQKAIITGLTEQAGTKARREGFYTGCMQEKYDRLFAAWKRTEKDKPPAEPKPK